METELICTICNQFYKDDNLPRMMPKCGHSFCQQCIKKLISSSTQQLPQSIIKIKCPDDQIIMKLQDRDINNFPKNISLIKLLQTSKELKKQNNNQSSFKDSSLNQSNINIKNSIDNNVDQQDKELITQITQSTKCTEQVLLYYKSNCQNQILQQQAKQQHQICQLHGKTLQIVCIQDLVKICATCAIFGTHKGHQFKGIQQIAKDKKQKMSKVIAVNDKNEQLRQKITKKQFHHQNVRLISEKKDSLIKQTKQRCSKLIKSIQHMQKKTLQKISKTIHKLQQKLNIQMKLPEIVQIKFKNWQKTVLMHLQTCLKQDNLQQLLMFLNYDKHSDQLDIIQEGQLIYEEFNNHIQELIKIRQQKIGEINLEINDDLQKKIGEYINVAIQNKENQKPVISKTIIQIPKLIIHNDDLLIDYEDHKNHQEQILYTIKVEQELNKSNNSPLEVQSNNKINVNQVLNKQQAVIHQINASSLPNKNQKTFQDQKNLINSKQITKQSTPKDNNSFVIQKNQLKNDKTLDKNYIKLKKQKIKIPQKYDKVLEGILTDSIQAADFTNAQLGDIIALQVVQNLKGKKVRNIKLIRNKLNDEGVDKMWGYFENIINLNLSQNFLTDNIIQRLILNLHKMPNLKNIILSQNRIKQRNVKGKVEQIKKKYEITVSL